MMDAIIFVDKCGCALTENWHVVMCPACEAAKQGPMPGLTKMCKKCWQEAVSLAGEAAEAAKADERARCVAWAVKMIHEIDEDADGSYGACMALIEVKLHIESGEQPTEG